MDGKQTNAFKTEQKLLSANKVNFLLPKSMIADGYKVSEHWPIVPNLLRASVHHSIDSLKNEGIEYDDAKGQWTQTLFPSWQPSGTQLPSSSSPSQMQESSPP